MGNTAPFPANSTAVKGGKMNQVHISTKSKQDYQTPPEFIQAVNRRWPICFDLAANNENKIHPAAYIEGIENSLERDWHLLTNMYMHDSLAYLWLNPPYKVHCPWMKKCAEEMKKGAKIVTLTLASIGSNWFKNYVQPNAMTYVLRGRLTFVGQKAPYPKELMLCVWDSGLTGFGFWDWRKK
jgi:phage N-6-adenine-methyltransferase